MSIKGFAEFRDLRRCVSRSLIGCPLICLTCDPHVPLMERFQGLLLSLGTQDQIRDVVKKVEAG